MKIQLTAIITGRVQMVMYRDFVQRRARTMSIVGTVENLSDGTVRVVAQGERELLEIFVGLLKEGSLLSRVDTAVTVFEDCTESIKGFTIIYS